MKARQTWDVLSCTCAHAYTMIAIDDWLATPTVHHASVDVQAVMEAQDRKVAQHTRDKQILMTRQSPASDTMTRIECTLMLRIEGC